MIKLRFVASLIVMLVALSSCQAPATTAITPAASVAPVPTATPPGLYHLGGIWPQAEPSSIVDQVTSPDGTIYAIDEAGNLTALRPSGQVLWEYPNKTPLTSGSKAPLLSPDGQQIYLTSSQSIIAISNKGVRLWDFYRPNEWIRSGPYLALDGSLYVQSYFINSTSSEKRGYRILPDGQVSSFSWPESFNVRNVGFDSQARIHLNEPGKINLTLNSDGKVLKRCAQPAYLNSKLLVSQENVTYYVTLTGEVIAQQEDCTILWRATPEENEIDFTRAAAPILLSDETLYVGGAGRIYAFDVQSGTLRWQSPESDQAGRISHMVISSDGTLYALSQRATWLVLDSRGQLKWMQPMYDAGAPSLFSLLPTGDLVAVRGGHLQAYTTNPEQVFVVPTPVPVPNDRAQAEAEIVEFMLNTIIYKQMGFQGELVRSVDKQPNFEARRIHWITWHTVTKELEKAFEYQLAEVLQEWWYADGELVEIKTPLPTITPDTTAPEVDHFVSYYGFGIVSISEDHQQAEVYLSIYRGPLSGQGLLYTLERSPSGQWWPVEVDRLWIS